MAGIFTVTSLLPMVFLGRSLIPLVPIRGVTM